MGKALAKVPADRFATASEFKAALSRALQEPSLVPPAPGRRRLATGLAAGLAALGAGVAGALLVGLEADRPITADGERPIRSLAVAPLENLTGDTAQVYLAQGITDQLVTTLAQIGALRVVGLKGSAAAIPAEELARTHRIDAVLSGSLQRAGEAVRIRIQLSSAVSGQALWAQSYDGELRAILGLQDEVARSVADRLRVSVTAEERTRLTAPRPAVSPAAYQAYVRGWHFLEKVSETDFRRAIGYFNQAINADPAYAAPYVGLANAYAGVGLLRTGGRQGDVSPGPRGGAQGHRAGLDARGGAFSPRQYSKHLRLGLCGGRPKLRAWSGAESTLCPGSFFVRYAAHCHGTHR